MQHLVVGENRVAVVLRPFGASACSCGARQHREIRELWLPFVKYARGGKMPWLVLLVLIYQWIVGFSNAINLTDSLRRPGGRLHHHWWCFRARRDGLRQRTTCCSREYLLTSHVPKTGELTVVCG